MTKLFLLFRIKKIFISFLTFLLCFNTALAQFKNAEAKIVNLSFTENLNEIMIDFEITDIQQNNRYNVWIKAYGKSKQQIKISSLRGDLGLIDKGKRQIFWNYSRDKLAPDTVSYFEIYAQILPQISYWQTMTFSAIVPGAGNAYLDRNPKYLITGALAYGLLSSAVIFNRLAITQYDSYLNAENNSQANDYFAKAQQSKKVSTILGVSAAAVWTFDLGFTYFKTRHFNRHFTDHYISNQKHKIISAKTPAGLRTKEKDKAIVFVEEVVDLKKIKRIGEKRKNTIGIVLGLENYKHFAPAPYAANDAAIMKLYFEKVLGIEKVFCYTNDDLSGFFFDNLFNSNYGELQKIVKKGETQVFIYYSGHAVPDKEGKEIYLLAADNKLESLKQQAFKLRTLIEHLEKLEAREVVFFIDACFSGFSRQNEQGEQSNLIAAKGGVRIKTNSKMFNSQQVNIFASSSSDETSLAFSSSQTGLFTYFLCLGLGGEADSNKDDKIEASELQSYLLENVNNKSRKISGLQTPQFFGNENLILVEFD